MEDRVSILREYAIVIALFSILTVILTYPMAFHVSDTIGDGDEAFTCWSLIWTTKYIIEDPANLFNANIFYPANEYSLALSEHLAGWTLFSIPVYALTHDPVFTHNFLRLLTFVLCGFGMYLLSYRYTKNRYAAFIAGIFFAFFEYRTGIQLHLLAMQWVPFMLLFLDRFFYSLSLRDILASSLFFIMEALSGWYVGIFSVIIGGIFIAGYIIFDTDVRKRLVTQKALCRILISLALISFILLPFAIPYFEASKHYDAERDIDTPFDSSWSFDIQTVIDKFGIFFLILAIIGIILPISSEKSKNQNRVTIFDRIRQQKIPIIFFIIGIISYILTLGPILKISGTPTGIFLPYYYVYSVVPFIAIIRDLSRFSFIISFAGSVLTGFGAAVIINRVKSVSYKTPVAIVLIILAIFVSWHGPVHMPASLATGDQVPQEYRWLANQTSDFAIIELPTRWVEDNSEYTYYSVYHWKDMVNGYSGRDVEEASKIMRDTGAFFPSNNTISLLQKIGVRYVLIHADRMGELQNVPLDKSDEFTTFLISSINHEIETNYQAVRFTHSFADTYIYEILPEPEILPDEVILLFQSGWYGSNILPEFFLKNSGKIKAYAKSEGDYRINFQAEPFYGEKNLTISVNAVEIGTITAPSGGFTEGGGQIHLNEGFNEIIFSSTCTKLCDIPDMENISDKCMSFKFTNLSVV
ncbi:MAG: hypothetical protein GXY48_10385 [Methanomicrobiales archaeon]|nr:hypothetical protein [Methanomicrobiales archaeon]